MNQNFSQSADFYAAESSSNSGRSLQDFVRWIVRGFWILLIGLIAGYFLGLYVYSITPESYRSYATIEILRVKRDSAEVDERERLRLTCVAELMSVVQRLRMRELFEKVAGSHLFTDRENVVPQERLLPWQSAKFGHNGEISRPALAGMMQEWVAVKWREDTTMLDISAKHSDPLIARDTLVGILSEYGLLTESRFSG